MRSKDEGEDLIENERESNEGRLRKKEGTELSIYSLGEYNRDGIYDCIVKHGPIAVHDIEFTLKNRKKRKYSVGRRQIHHHINELLQQGLIRKVQGYKYVATDEDTRYVTTFGDIIKDAFSFLIDYPLFDSSYQFGLMFRNEDTFGGYVDDEDFKRFREKVNDFSISDDLLQQLASDKIRNDAKKEMHLMEFANRIGAYIIYMFIQTMAPMKLNTLPDQVTDARRDGLSRKLLQRSIDTEMMFKFFHALLFYTGQMKKPFPKKHETYTFFELDQEDYNSVTKTFQNVYPNIFTAFEQYYKNFSDHQLTDTIDKTKENEVDCKHEWKETDIFKLNDKRYHCYKCDSFITRKTYDKMMKDSNKT